MPSFLRGAPLFASIVLFAAAANANGLEIPENGTEVMGRAGAWTARADNPLATALNPAGLAGQHTSGLLNANLTWQSQCFTRQGNYASGGINTGTPFADGSYEGQPFPEVCKKNGIGQVNVIPQLGFTFEITPKLGIGILPLWTPSGTGAAEWPDANYKENGTSEVTAANGSPAPAPQRFLLWKKDAKIIAPTFGLGYEVLPGLRVGASFQWVITIFKSSVGSQATQTNAGEAAQGGYNVTRSDISWTKWFTPAFVLGAMYSPHDDVDIGAMFRWSAPITKQDGDVTVYAPYYGNPNRATTAPARTDIKFQEMKLPQPWEIRAGVRWHPHREGVELAKEGRRDFLANDKFDLELDAIYANNSQFDKLTVSFYEDTRVTFGQSATAGFAPPAASIEKNWKNTIAIRLGGEYVAIPDKLGIRAGAFWQSKGQDEAYLNLDFHPGAMVGGYLGATLRLTKAVDLAAGAGYIWVQTFDNTATGGQLRGLTSTKPAADKPYYAGACNDTSVPQYRTCAIVNTGVLKTHYIMASLGTTVHF
jgi:long-chain fatty acid transport protein